MAIRYTKEEKKERLERFEKLMFAVADKAMKDLTPIPQNVISQRMTKTAYIVGYLSMKEFYVEVSEKSFEIGIFPKKYWCSLECWESLPEEHKKAIEALTKGAKIVRKKKDDFAEDTPEEKANIEAQEMAMYKEQQEREAKEKADLAELVDLDAQIARQSSGDNLAETL